MIQLGRSFSGYERNCCFLNTRNNRFADVSALAGFEQLDDGRTLAVSDWDQDGDLDIWLANRTGPRLRFLQNEGADDNTFVAFKLIGDPTQHCNRDAIGARVELSLSYSDTGKPVQRLVRTLCAGDSFLSQSSKWLHFGIPDKPSTRIDRVTVRWPGGIQEERFESVAPGARYELIQGSGIARKIEKARIAARKTEPHDDEPMEHRVDETQTTPAGRLRFLQPVGMSRISYENYTGNEVLLTLDDGRPTLITLWATWCPNCLHELTGYSTRHAAMDKFGVRCLLLNVDRVSNGPIPTDTDPQELLKKLAITSAQGRATVKLIEALNEAVQSRVYARKPLALPCSALIDSAGRVVAVYQGQLSDDQLAHDVRNLDCDTATARQLAVPLAGRWTNRQFRSDPISIARVYMEGDYLQDARQVLIDHLAKETGPPDAVSGGVISARNRRLADVLRVLGQLDAGRGQLERSLSRYRESLRFRPDWRPAIQEMVSIQTRLGDSLRAKGKTAEAVQQYVDALRWLPGWPPAANNLAWIRATNPNASLRNGSEALELAEAVCRASDFEEPAALDTLAAAYAETGQFDRAIELAERAAKFADLAGKTELARQIGRRIQLYRNQQPYREET